MFFGPFIFILLIIGLVFLFIRPNQGYYGHGGCHTNTYASSDRALDILKERYAKGEITDEEYARMKKNLE